MVPGTGDLLWYGRPGPLVGRTFYGKIRHCQGGLSDDRMIITIIRVLVKEFLYKGMMGWKPVFKCLFVRCVWVPTATSCNDRP
jgi:hypothetical protein